MLNVALPKGRLGEKVYRLFDAAGLSCPDFFDDHRKLVLEGAGARYFLIKPSDVGIYVERGAADIGVVGRDVLLETEPDVYELLDLKLGRCRPGGSGACVPGRAARRAAARGDQVPQRRPPLLPGEKP